MDPIRPGRMARLRPPRSLYEPRRMSVTSDGTMFATVYTLFQNVI